jgi:hypothetical protein
LYLLVFRRSHSSAAKSSTRNRNPHLSNSNRIWSRLTVLKFLQAKSCSFYVRPILPTC